MAFPNLAIKGLLRREDMNKTQKEEERGVRYQRCLEARVAGVIEEEGTVETGGGGEIMQGPGRPGAGRGLWVRIRRLRCRQKGPGH